MINKDSLNHHISAQFNAELEDIRSHLLAMGGLVEKQVNDAVNALVVADSGLAQQVREVDDQINQMERDIDEECVRILARRQPAASDLRLIISISKSVIDLERTGDEASKIAKRAIQLCEEGEAPRGYVEVRHIGEQVRKMVQESLDAFARFDAELALSVAQYDKTVDREYKTALRELVTYMMEDPRSISRVLSVIWALRSLERIGDHARNIAELVIYLVRGTDVRHIGLERMQAEVKGEGSRCATRAPLRRRSPPGGGRGARLAGVSLPAPVLPCSSARSAPPCCWRWPLRPAP